MRTAYQSIPYTLHVVLAVPFLAVRQTRLSLSSNQFLVLFFERFYFFNRKLPFRVFFSSFFFRPFTTIFHMFFLQQYSKHAYRSVFCTSKRKVCEGFRNTCFDVPLPTHRPLNKDWPFLSGTRPTKEEKAGGLEATLSTSLPGQ